MESNLRYMRPPSQKEKEFGTIQWCWTSVYESVYSSSVHVSQRPETSWNLSVTCPSLITVCLHTEDCAIMKPWQRRGQSPLSNAEFQSGWGGGKRSPRCCRVHTPLKPRQRSAVLFSDGNYAPNRGSVASGRGTPGDPVNPETSVWTELWLHRVCFIVPVLPSACQVWHASPCDSSAGVHRALCQVKACHPWIVIDFDRKHHSIVRESPLLT